MVAEFGVDKLTKKKVNMELQMEVFKIQFFLSCELQRPISIHCVQSFTHIIEFLLSLPKSLKLKTFSVPTQFFPKYVNSETLQSPPKIIFHSFGGTTEIVERLLKIPIFGDQILFGLSHQTLSKSPKALKSLSSIPEDRMILESDSDNLESSIQNIESLINLISQNKQCSRNHLILITSNNSQSLFESIPSQSHNQNELIN